MPARGALALLTMVVVVSCGGRTDSTEPSIKLDDFPGRVVRAFCENIGPCCESAGRAFDFATCFSRSGPAAAAILSVPPAVADNRIPSRCLHQVESAALECRVWTACPEFLAAVADRSSSCAAGVCAPALPEGAACTDDHQCASARCATGQCEARAIEDAELDVLCAG